MIRLRRIRISKGWSLEYVANKVGVTKAAIHDLETGRRKGSIRVWDALEDLFTISQRKLREEENERSKNAN